MQNELAKIAAYYRACYQADYRAIHLLSFYSKKVQHTLWLQGAELLTGAFTEMPAPTEWAKEADAFLDIYSREKALFVCAFFLIGKSRILGRNRTVCAPLLIYPAGLAEEDEIYNLRIDTSNPILNPAVLEVLNASGEYATVTLEELTELVPAGDLNFDNAYRLEQAMAGLFPDLEKETLSDFPELIAEEKIKELLKRSGKPMQIVSAAAVGIIDKGKGARGVINELGLLSEGEDFSGPIRTLFGKAASAFPSGKQKNIYAPALLSTAQEQVLHNAYKFPLSMVVGPPGTGKTFTIASLAVDLMSKGQSVLIASRNNQAVKVVAEKIESDLNLRDVVVQATTGSYRKAVKKQLQNWFRGIGLEYYSDQSVRSVRKELVVLDNEIVRQLETINLWEEKTRKWGRQLSEYDESWLAQLKRWYIQHRVERNSPFWKSVSQLEDLYWRRRQLLQDYLRMIFHYRLRQVLKKDRWVIRQLIAALSARTGNKKENLYDEIDVSVMLRCLPIWVTNTTDVHQLLPAYTEMFDVVIIDEASQCDIASALPVLQRAKRAVIVGDPKQLRHLSFVSERQQQLFREQFGLTEVPDFWLDYRDYSLLDLVADQLPNQEQVQMLDEHFRSLPDIIAFSNRHFYNNKLHIMTDLPGADRNSVQLHIGNGKREEQGHNLKEAEAVLRKIRTIMDADKDLDNAFCQSIGILSPFRAQVEYLQKQIAENFSAKELLRHRVLIGTPFAFQGEERDIMLLSFALEPQSPAGVWNYLNREDIFNVSITRARVEQHLFLSGKPADFPNGNMLRAYLDALMFRRERAGNPIQEERVKDGFMRDVMDCLESWGMDKVYSNYKIGGVALDLVVVHRNKTFSIDLIGFPGPHSGFLSHAHWKMMSRLGIPVFALPYTNWHFQPLAAQTALRNYLMNEHL
ncbi:MAG: AAA domain-containing protein [Saprospiraceae bacterium]|nr:AAA family ATPase [Lewinella sp.]